MNSTFRQAPAANASECCISTALATSCCRSSGIRPQLYQSVPLHGLLQLLGGPEVDLLAGLDLDGLASPWISPHTSGTILNLPHAESGQADFVAILECWVANAIRSLTTSSAGFFGKPWFSANAAAICLSVIVACDAAFVAAVCGPCWRLREFVT
jgi:hypothetical protein